MSSSQDKASKPIDVVPVADAIDAAAKALEDRAKELRDFARRMRESGDITYATEAINVLQHLTSATRPDLIMARALRATGAV